jgi:hypothetical protein
MEKNDDRRIGAPGSGANQNANQIKASSLLALMKGARRIADQRIGIPVRS